MRRWRQNWKSLTLEGALTCLEQGTLPSPTIDDFECILHQCRKKRNLNYALRLHAHMRQSGLESHGLLGNSLVTVLTEVGSMCHAQQVFNRLVFRSENSWNALIMGYIQYGKSKNALTLYQQMQEDHSVRPTERSFVALVKACTKLKDVERGIALHATISNLGLLENNIFVAATVVDMYAKCGLLHKARQVLDKLQARDVVSWNALISGYMEHECNEEALRCYEQLQLEGLSPNAVTFVCSLKACGGLLAANKGSEIHAEIARKGLLEESIYVGNSLVDMYARCGFLSEAQEVYDKLPAKDVVSCNALIVGYTEHGDSEDALKRFKLMELEGIAPNSITYICSLKASGKAENKGMGSEIHSEVARQGLLEKDVTVGNALMDMYAKCGLLANAQEVFNKLPFRDVVSFNALITGYAEYGHGKEALKFFKQMQFEGVTPDAITFICSLKAFGSMGLIDEAQEIHADIIKMGLVEGNLGVGNSLVDVYSKCGWCAEAQDVFNKLQIRDLVSWNTIIAGYVEHGYSEEGFECFEQMQLQGVLPNAVTFVSVVKACGSTGVLDKGQEIHAEIIRKGLLEVDPFVGSALVDMYIKCGAPANAQEVFDKLCFRDTIMWNSLLAGYVEHDPGQEALECFERMQLQGVSSDYTTFVFILKACSNVGARDKGREIHAELAAKGLLDGNIVVGNALIDMYAKCISLVDGQEVLDKLEVRDVVSWNALIAGYAQLGESEQIFLSLSRMVEESIKPNAITFASVLKGCAHAALFDKGQNTYEYMINDHGIVPTLEHQNCMVDLLCRAGHLDKAIAMVQEMPNDPNLVVWDIVLSACKKWGNLELGMLAFENFVQLDADDAGAYVTMSHIYASNGTEESTFKLREWDFNSVVVKRPGHQ